MASTLKKYLPKSPGDWCAVFFTVFAIHTVGLFELFVILPYIDADRTKTFWFHVLCGCFLYFNIISSFVLIIRTDSTISRSGLVLPSVLRHGWRFCSACEANAPPRSYHCWNCDLCILRRDHHCVFTGNCVGLHNHRYYITMVFHLVVAATYCNYLNMDYAWEVLGGFSLRSVFTMIMPLFSWMLGFAGTYTFLVSFVSALCVLGFFLLGALLAYHMLNMLQGQTTYERGQGIKEYNQRWERNVQQVMGKLWYISWVSPWISSPLPIDGTDFPSKRALENVKDL